jgi:hypothetical protein
VKIARNAIFDPIGHNGPEASMTVLLNPELLAADPLPVTNTEFPATIRAHGEYMPLAYVLRLSPLIHRTLAALPQTGIYTSREIGLDGAQAFSTYLHETVHWWQHIGSTYGLMCSLSYPARAHGNYNQIKKLVSLGALKKSVRQMAEKANGPSTPDTVTGLANIVVNNHFDLSAFSKFSYDQEFAKSIASNIMFESLGHVMRLTYGHNLFSLAATIDKEFAALPDPRTWEAPFRKLKDDKVEGFYYGSRVGLWPVGARNHGRTGVLRSNPIFTLRLWWKVRMGHFPRLWHVAWSLRGSIQGILGPHRAWMAKLHKSSHCRAISLTLRHGDKPWFGLPLRSLPALCQLYRRHDTGYTSYGDGSDDTAQAA